MKLRLNKIVGALLLVAITGCTTQKMADLPRQSIAEARATFKALSFEEWAVSPFVRSEALCGAQRFDITFSDLKYAHYSIRMAKLIVAAKVKSMCTATYTFNLKDVDDARRLVAAANSLGAAVDRIVIMD